MSDRVRQQLSRKLDDLIKGSSQKVVQKKPEENADKYLKNLFGTVGQADPEVIGLNALNDYSLGNISEKQYNQVADFLTGYEPKKSTWDKVGEFLGDTQWIGGKTGLPNIPVSKSKVVEK